MPKLRRISLLMVSLLWCCSFIACEDSGKTPESTKPWESIDLSGFPTVLQSRIFEEHQALEKGPDNFAVLFDLGRLYHANRFYDRAEELYIRILDTVPNKSFSKIHYYLAHIALNKGALDRAVLHLAEVVKLERDYLPAYLVLGDSLYKLNLVEEALSAYRTALKLDKANPYAGIALAREALDRGERGVAVQFLEGIFSAYPQFSEGLVLLVKLLEEKGETGRAEELRKRNESGWDLPQFDPWLEELLDFSYDLQGLGFRFEDFKRVGEYDRALTYLQRMEQIDPTSPSPHLLRGSLFYDLERREEAEIQLFKAIEKGAPPELAYPLLVKTLVELEKQEDAKAVALKGLSKDSSIPVLWLSLGGLEIQRQNFAQAKKYLRKAFALDPADGFVNRLLADLYSKERDLINAVKHQQILSDLFPDDDALLVSLAKNFSELNQPDQAVEVLYKANRVMPADEPIRLLLAGALENAGKLRFGREDYVGAINYFSEAIRFGSASIELFGVKTQAHIRLSQLDKAELTVKQVIALYPDRAFFYSNLGDIQEANGKMDEARSSWSVALKLLSPNDPPGMRMDLESRLRKSPLD